MKYLPTIAGILLSLVFLMASVTYFLGVEGPAPTPGSPTAVFMGVFAPSGYLGFVKVFELLGAILVAIPRLRNLGLLVLGPIVLNILAFDVFIAKSEGMNNPMAIVMTGLIVVLPLYLLWVERRAFAGLVTRRIDPV